MVISTIRGDMTCISGIPLALMAVSSDFSPRLPNDISDASRMASGRAIGIMERAA